MFWDDTRANLLTNSPQGRRAGGALLQAWLGQHEPFYKTNPIFQTVLYASQGVTSEAQGRTEPCGEADGALGRGSLTWQNPGVESSPSSHRSILWKEARTKARR